MCWTFVYFPDVSVDSVKPLNFSDAVGRKLTILR